MLPFACALRSLVTSTSAAFVHNSCAMLTVWIVASIFGFKLCDWSII